MVIKFGDSYVREYTRKGLRKILVHTVSEKIGRQLDYVLVSTRWRSCVLSSKPKWGPAIHRDLHGEKNDHALVECLWKWRIRTVKPQPAKDFEPLYAQKYSATGKLLPNEAKIAFEEAIKAKLLELDYDEVDDDPAAMYDKICTAIHHAIDTTLPDRAKRSNIRRKVSDRTKRLFDQRQLLRGKGNKE